MSNELPTYRPGNPVWRAGFEHAKRQVADHLRCGCPHAAEVAQCRPNSAERWRLCGQSSCAALEAAELLTLRPEPPTSALPLEASSAEPLARRAAFLLRRLYGPRCDAVEPGCVVCQVYALIDQLEDC